jgi:hypothetical protein
MSSFVQTVRKQRSSTRNQSTRNQTADAREGLPDIAEAEAVLLDLARVFSDPATGRAYVLDDLAEKGKEPAADVHAPNLEAKYRALLEQIPAVYLWLISTEASAKRMSVRRSKRHSAIREKSG